MLLLLAVACSPPSTQLTTTTPTSGGSWMVSISEEPLEAGGQYLYLAVTDAAGQPAGDLAVTVQAAMVDMGYAGERVEAVEQPDGDYAFYADLAFEGVWSLLGEVTRARSEPETFILQVEVR